MPDSDAGVDLTKLLEDFFADNLLEYTCEKCGHKESRASHALHRLPRFLVIHCKRFKPNFEKGIYEKLTTRVNAPRTLNLGKHCSPTTRPPPPCDDAGRIQAAVASPCKEASSSVVADLTRSTQMKPTGARADKLHESGDNRRGTGIGFEDVSSDKGSGVTRKLNLDGAISPDEERGEDGSAAENLRSFLNSGSREAAKPRARYGTSAFAQQKRGAETDASTGTHKQSRLDFRGDKDRDRRRQTREQEEADLQLALERSMNVTHRMNWVDEEEAEATEKPRVRDGSTEKRKRSRERPADAADAPSATLVIDDDDEDDKPLLVHDDEVEMKAQKKRAVVLGTERGTPAKADASASDKGGKDRDSDARGKRKFDKGDFTLGDEDEDLQRALALSAQDECEVQILDSTGDAEKAVEGNEDCKDEERADSPFDLCASDDEEPGEGCAPLDAGYTLQVFHALSLLLPAGFVAFLSGVGCVCSARCACLSQCLVQAASCHRTFPSCPLLCKRMCGAGCGLARRQERGAWPLCLRHFHRGQGDLESLRRRHREAARRRQSGAGKGLAVTRLPLCLCSQQLLREAVMTAQGPAASHGSSEPRGQRPPLPSTCVMYYNTLNHCSNGVCAAAARVAFRRYPVPGRVPGTVSCTSRLAPGPAPRFRTAQRVDVFI